MLIAIGSYATNPWTSPLPHNTENCYIYPNETDFATTELSLPVETFSDIDSARWAQAIKDMCHLCFTVSDCHVLTQDDSSSVLYMSYACMNRFNLLFVLMVCIHFSEDPLLPLYKMSYLWYSSIGMSTTVVIGLIVTCITGRFNLWMTFRISWLK